MIHKIILTLLLGMFCASAGAQNIGRVTKLPIPRFVTLKSNKVNMRNGPSKNYPIKLQYKRKGYPLEIVLEFENWRKVQDVDGVIGWIHKGLLAGSRSIAITGNKYANKSLNKFQKSRELLLFRHPDETSYPILRMQFGVLANIKKCTKQWCKVSASGISGWAKKANLWGVYDSEIID